MVMMAGDRRSIFAEVIHDPFMGLVLFVDLQNASVFKVRGRENLSRFAGEKYSRVGLVAVDEAADDEHGRKKSASRGFANAQSKAAAAP
jgi:hypothetical protein